MGRTADKRFGIGPAIIGWFCIQFLGVFSAQATADHDPTSPTGLLTDPSLPLPVEKQEDIDGDGNIDCWEAHWEGGNGIGGIQLTIRLGCGSEALLLSNTASFADFFSAMPLPAAVVAHPRLLDAVIGRLLGKDHVWRLDVGPDPAGERLDGSFRWLVDFYRDHADTNAAPFQERRSFTPVWTQGWPRVPAPQSVLVFDPTLVGLVNTLLIEAEIAPEALRPGLPFALLTYYAHNHGRLVRVAACDAFDVWKTAHGVVVYDRVRHASSWSFIASGLDKLRHPSLGRIRCDGDLVVFNVKAMTQSRLVAVLPRAGYWAYLPLEDAHTWSLDRKRHVLHVGRARYRKMQLIKALRGPPAAERP